MSAIQPLSPQAIASLADRSSSEIARPQSGAPVGQGGFADLFANALEGASNVEHAAEDAARRFAAGDPSVGIHEVVISSEEANISLRYAVTLKNRVLEAYRELMNTAV